VSPALLPGREPQARAGAKSQRATFLAVEIVALVALPAIVSGWFVWDAATRGILAFDARVGYLPSARGMVHGVSPYPTANLPPFGFSLFVPFTAVPRPEYLLTVLAIVAVPAILLVLDVRDWRCYGAVFLWTPVLSAIQTVNLTLLLVLAAALAWRWRDLAAPTAAALGLSIAAKLISAPLVVWLAATRRVRAAVLSVVIAVGVTVGLLGLIQAFEGQTGSFVGKAGSVPGRGDTFSYSPIDFASEHGLSRLLGGTAVALVVILLCGLSVHFARQGDDPRSFAAAATAIVVFAPNVWLHSLCFLLLPLGLLRPRFDGLWLVPVVLIGVSVGNTSVPQWLLFWAVALLVAGWSLARPLPRCSDVAVPDERPLARAAKASAGEST
jgi:hypothetical protein